LADYFVRKEERMIELLQRVENEAFSRLNRLDREEAKREAENKLISEMVEELLIDVEKKVGCLRDEAIEGVQRYLEYLTRRRG
jgi:hypothetical protein